MNTAQADRLAAREHLRQHGWIARRSEAFHHLPPPALTHWLGEQAEGTRGDDCAAPPLSGAGWTLLPLQGQGLGAGTAGGVDARWLDAADPEQRAQLFAGLPGPGEGEAAPFAWAHRALCRQGRRVHVAARPGHARFAGLRGEGQGQQRQDEEGADGHDGGLFGDRVNPRIIHGCGAAQAAWRGGM